MRSSKGPGQRPVKSRVATAAAAIIEKMESRVLMSTNVWTNGASTGNWNFVDANWTAPTTWNNGDTAQFGGPSTGQTVALSTSGISAAGLIFDSNGAGDTLTGTSANALTLTGGSGDVNLGGQSETITATIAGNLNLAGTGTLLYNASPTFPAPGDFDLIAPGGNVVVDNSTLHLINPNGTTTTYGGSSPTGVAPSEFNLNGGASLTVQNGGHLSNFLDFYLGTSSSTSNNNSILVTGSGTTANIDLGGNGNTHSDIGDLSSGNSFTINNGASANFNKGNGTNFITIGDFYGSNNNSMTVDNATLAASGHPLTVGGAGEHNTLLIENGATIGNSAAHPYTLAIGSGTAQTGGPVSGTTTGTDGGSYNSATITGAGSDFSTTTATNSQFYMGASATAHDNSLTISAGGNLTVQGGSSARQMAIGEVGSNNVATVTGSGSTMVLNSLSLPVTIGAANSGGTGITDAHATGDALDVYNGGAFSTTSSIYLGTDATINLGDGTSTSTITVGKGTNVTSGGIVFAGTGDALNINGGALVATASTMVSGPGTINLNGAATFDTASGSSITSNITGAGSLTKGALTGTVIINDTTTYNGNTTVLAGTLDFVNDPGLASTSTVSIAGGTTHLQLDNSATDTVASLILNGVTQAAGVYNSGNTAGAITGSGSIKVATIGGGPAWLASTSNATYSSVSHILNVTGASTIIADPGTDEPIIQASGVGAQLTINPTVASPVDVHVGSIQLTSGAGIDMTSVGISRSHSNHNVLVVGTTGKANDPTFSIDSSSKLNLEDNDLVYHTGSTDTSSTGTNSSNNGAGGGAAWGGTGPTDANIQGKVAVGRDGGFWDGNELTSSTVENQDNNVDGYETEQLAVVDNGDLASPYASWTVGTASETLGANDIIVKDTYTGDYTLDGKVNFNDSSIFGLYYDNGATTSNEWAFGDTDGNGILNFNDSSNFGLAFNNGTGSLAAQDPTQL